MSSGRIPRRHGLVLGLKGKSGEAVLVAKIGQLRRGSASRKPVGVAGGLRQQPRYLEGASRKVHGKKEQETYIKKGCWASFPSLQGMLVI